MSIIGRFLMDTITRPFTAAESAPKEPFGHPTTADILVVKRLIYEASKRELPLELIDIIIDHAEYWRCVTSQMSKPRIATGNAHGTTTDTSDILLLRSYPLGYDPRGNNRYQLNANCLTHSTFLKRGKYGQASLAVEGDLTPRVLRDWQTHYQRRGEYLCRKIVFTLESRDQGWGNSSADQGTFRGSYTWFDVGKEKFQAASNVEALRDVVASDQTLHAVVELNAPNETAWGVFKTIDIHPLSTSASGEQLVLKDHTMPSNRRLQSNRTATRGINQYTITWSYTDDISGDPEPDSQVLNDLALNLEAQGRGAASHDGTFIRSLQIGDVVTLWARARFPGWRNQVDAAKMEIYWAV